MAETTQDKELRNALAADREAVRQGAIMQLGEAPWRKCRVSAPGVEPRHRPGRHGVCRAGRMIEIFGPEASGKTTVTLHAVAKAQRDGGVAAFIDAEHALDPAWAKRIGVDLEDLLVSQPSCAEEGAEDRRDARSSRTPWT